MMMSCDGSKSTHIQRKTDARKNWGDVCNADPTQKKQDISVETNKVLDSTITKIVADSVKDAAGDVSQGHSTTGENSRANELHVLCILLASKIVPMQEPACCLRFPDWYNWTATAAVLPPLVAEFRVNVLCAGDGARTAGVTGSAQQREDTTTGGGVPEDYGVAEEAAEDEEVAKQAARDTSTAPRADIRDIIAATVEVL